MFILMVLSTVPQYRAFGYCLFFTGVLHKAGLCSFWSK